MKRVLALTLACALSLGCQSEPKASQESNAAERDVSPSYQSLFERGAGKLVAAVKALPKPLKELRIGKPSNRTRELLDTRQLEHELTAQLLEVEGLVIVERDDAPWLVTSTIGSEEVRRAEGRTITTTLQLQVVNTRGILASVEATQVDKR